ncbi:prolipoprotein diacylglyceryl transferase [Roseovarius pelagicus]|uniref:Phosphatidylglycerol--prolipoprotein diacylglyceryl transferase n=1 Tax=Roseovarius pelagicus TaxID=2980108 RepID=A0ABY6DGL6_9RHOB|nr:prolipoprotein diacylglyceryl transferase [Roseovarius pelagicus]UXX85253.1 prolipoprotein diacylglyceryl transferase [Roseovarius pelagicus]
MLAAAIPFPDIGTELFAIDIGTFHFALRWYALAYIVGIVIGMWICVLSANRAAFWPISGPPLTSKQVEDLATWIILGVIIGGRLGFVILYQPEYYLQNPLEIFMVWQGGMSFHGGFIGVIIAGTVFSTRQRAPLLGTADLLALATPPGLLLGRLANFTNNELWGRPTDVWWGVIFPGQAAQACPGVTGLCARHPSQLYQALLEGLLLGGLLLILAWRRGWLKWPGAVTGTFLAGYGLSRAFVEFFRQPDMQFVSEGNPIGHALHFGTGGLTMGQTLSLPMIFAGLMLIWWVFRKKNRDRGQKEPETA